MGKKRKKRSRDASRGYEAALSIPSRRHPLGADQSQDAAANDALKTIRDWARYLDENSDIAHAVLNELVARTVGTGIVTLPKPLRDDGSVDEPLGVRLIALWKRWTRACDVTGTLPWSRAQRLIARAWQRDGEQFLQHVSGREIAFPFAPTDTPYRIELLESEMVPWELTTEEVMPDGTRAAWRQGVRRNAWGAPNAYGVHRTHPGDSGLALFSRPVTFDDVKVLPARAVTHLKHTLRHPATRGISVFAPTIARFYDIKDLEESERIKNRILASWTAAIRRSPDVPGLDDADTNGDRFLEMVGGGIIDTLAPGEDIVGVGPDYPVTGMDVYLNDQLRRLAAGTGTQHSSISRNYGGTYAAQRQELVEGLAHARIREDDFVQLLVRPVYERVVMAAALDGQIVLPSDPEALERAMNADHYGPAVPWIDPLREVQAEKLAVDEGFTTLDAVRIKRGAPPELIGTAPPQRAIPARQPAQLSLIEDDEENAA